MPTSSDRPIFIRENNSFTPIDFSNSIMRDSSAFDKAGLRIIQKKTKKISSAVPPIAPKSGPEGAVPELEPGQGKHASPCRTYPDEQVAQTGLVSSWPSTQRPVLAFPPRHVLGKGHE